MRRVLPAGTLGPTLLVGEDEAAPALVAKLITTVAEEDLEPLAAALTTRAEAQPAHPGLVPIADVGIDGGAVYVVAAFVDAPALETRLRGGRQPLVQVLEWLAPVAAGLDAAHANGCLHGAVHPRDVLLPRGRGTLTGLDVSPALEALGLQAPVRVPFTAPERASGRPWDARADQYSLAMLALDALSGRRLIAGTIPAFDRWTLADTPGEDARLHEVFARALHPDPAERFATVAAWLEALTGAAEPGTDLSRFTREGVIPPPQPSPRRQRDADIADEALPLALFPAEEPDADPERTVAAAPAHPPRPARSGDADAAADADTPPPSAADGPSPTGEWLVAAMNDDLPPLADTGPLPIQSLDEAREVAPADRPSPPPAPGPPPRAAATAPDDSDADDFSFRDDEAAEDADADMRAFDLERGADDVRSSEDEDEQRWTQAFAPEADDSGRWRTGLVIAAAALLLALVAFGTWRSLVRDEAPAPDLGAEQTGPAPDAVPEQPATVDESPLAPSAADVAEGAPPPAETLPESASPVASSDAAISPAPAEAPQTAPASPTASAPTPAASGSPSPAASSPAATPGATASGEAPLSLDRARVLIRSSPSGQVRINGELRGQTPLVLRDLPFGSYVITISRAGYVDAVRQVDMLPSQPVASIAVDLERAAAAGAGPSSQPPPSAPAAPRGAPSPAPAPETGVGSLYVVSRPADARLSIDGQAYGTAPAVVPGLSAGRHQVRVEYPGYRVWVGTVEVRPGQRVRVDATLVQEPR